MTVKKQCLIMLIGMGIASAVFAATSENNAPPIPILDDMQTAEQINAASANASNETTNTASDDQLPATPPEVRPVEKPYTADDLGRTQLGREAFTQMIHNLMPLSPDQITTLRRMFDNSQRAVAEYPGTPPRPTSSSILVNMSPGATPPIIRLRSGYVTSLVFLDSTGQPWPIVGYDLGNPQAFNIQPSSPDGKSNTLIIQALDQYREGNLAVMLKDENTPVMLTLIPGQRAVDYRVDLRIPGLGPNAVVTTVGLPPTENPMLINFLDGIAPTGAKELDVVGAPAQAWLYFGHIFLRTRVTVLSPGWYASVSSPDGTHVFELAKTPIILASQRGEMIKLSIKGL